MAEEPDFEVLAASLRADSQDLDVFVETLAVKLEAALPKRTRVARRGLLANRKRVHRLVLELGDERLTLERHGSSVEARRATSVRGIVLKNESLGLDAWIASLARAVARAGEASERDRLALERLLGVANGSEEEAR